MNESLVAVVLFGAVFGVAGLITWLVAVRDAAHHGSRLDRVIAAAHDRQWPYLPSDPSLVGRFQVSPFNDGTERTYTNVVRGSDRGRELILFDFRHETYVPVNGGFFAPATFRVLAVALRGDRSEHEQLIKTVPDVLAPHLGLRAAVDLDYLLLFDGRQGRATGKGQHWILELDNILPLVGQLLSRDHPSPPTRLVDGPRSPDEPSDL